MSNPPTIITNPTSLIKNQPGTIVYYVDISDNFDMVTLQNTFPAPDRFYFLQNGSEKVGREFFSYPYNEDLSSNFQLQVTTLFSRPSACAFDTNGYLYISDLSVNIITAFNPTFYQTNNLAYMYRPFGVKFNPTNGNLYVTCLSGVDALDSPYGAILTLTPNYNASLNPSGVNFTYNNFFDTNGDFVSNGNSAPKTDYCYIPYDIVFGNSGNVFVSNFGYFPGYAQVGGFISKLFVNNGIVTDAAVVISTTCPTDGTTETLGGSTTACCRDLDFAYPSGMAFDSINSYLYVANSNNDSGQITMYSITPTSITKLATFKPGEVGNKRAFTISGGQPITALQLDNYGNLYYIYDNNADSPADSKTTINALSISVDGSDVVTATLIYSHEIININTKYNSFLNYAYGFSFKNGNIFLTANISRTGAVRGGAIIEIQNAFTFTDASLNSGSNTLSIFKTSTEQVSFEIQVPESNTLISNEVPYTNQSTILTYYDTINSANSLVPTSNYTYNLVDVDTDTIVSSVQVIENNEIIYAPFSNEPGNLNYPISMDFDSYGNLYVLNNPQNGVIFLTIITPNSGNFQKQYKPSLTITYPTAIRYNKNDNCMYITSFDINSYGTIFRIQTEIISNNPNYPRFGYPVNIEFKIITTFFYQNLTGNDICHCPMDLVFDNDSSLYISCAGSLNIASGNASAAWNANITKCEIDYSNGPGVITDNIYLLVEQNLLGNYISGIEVDDKYVYVVSAPDSTQYSEYPATPYGNCYTNISQFDKNNGELIQRWNAGYVGKLPDVVNFDYYNIYTNNISSTLKFDALYKNLFYITYYNSTNYTQPYYLDASGDILYNPPTSGSYYVQAFVPTSGSAAPVFTHAMKSSPLQPIYGMALYNGNIFVSQYTNNKIIKLIYVLSFGNYGYGTAGSRSSLILKNKNNSFYITGGNTPIYDIFINDVETLGNVFSSAVIITNPTPLLEGKPGTLYYYDNPSTSSPAPNTRYFLVNSSGKVVSNNYISNPGNENTIIYNNLSSPKCMTIDEEGYLYIANYGRYENYENGSIVKSTIQGKIIYIKQNINIGKPYAIKYNPKDGLIYYINTSPSKISGIDYFYIYIMSPDGDAFTKIFQDQSYNYLYNPYDMCFDSVGNLYIANGYTTTASGASINGSITKITLQYNPFVEPRYVEVFSNLLTGLSLNSSGNVIVSGLAIDNITKYLYVVTGANEASDNNINISQIPLTGNDAGYVSRKWQLGEVGNSQGQSALNFDTFGNLYYYSYSFSSNICLLKAFNPYTNISSTYSHQLLGGAVSGAYGIVYYDGNFYSSQSALNPTSGTYIDNVVKINASYFFTGVTLHAGDNILSINTVLPNQIVIRNISVNASGPKYYTIPSPPVAGKPSKLIYEYEGVITPTPGNNYVVVNSNMDYVSGILQNYNPGDEPNPYTFTFENLILPGGSNYLYIFDITAGELVAGSNMLIRVPVICFYKGTKILCLLNGKEIYVPIEKIGEGTMIKTYKRGYRKVKYNVKGKLKNTSEHSIDKLFKLSRKKVPELTEDLYITGGHALLHDSLDESETILMKKVVYHAAHNYNSIYNTKIEDKYKLLAYHDKRFEEIMMNKDFEIYHIVLESENETSNYGIYANGILAESTDDLTIMRMKGFEKINKTSESLYKFVNSMNVKKYPEQVKRALTAKMN